jgi:hypothetical protein
MNLGIAALRIGLGLIVALGAVVGIVYATDYGVQATVRSTQCGTPGFLGSGAGTGAVTIQTKIAGLRHTQAVPNDQCLLISPGNFVVYHIRSGRTSLYKSEGGTCIYDSVGGAGGCPP